MRVYVYADMSRYVLIILDHCVPVIYLLMWYVVSKSDSSLKQAICQSVGSKMRRARGQAVPRIVCDRTRKIWPFVGLEPHPFCYPGRYPKPVKLEETFNPCLAAECIITDANTFHFRTVQHCSMYSHRERAMKHVQEGGTVTQLLHQLWDSRSMVPERLYSTNIM